MYDYIHKPIIFIGAPRSGTTIISEIIMQHPDLAWPSNYQEALPAFPGVNYLRQFFENRLWSVSGNKQQLHATSPLNKYYFKPSECYRMWEYITGDNINFSRGFLINEKAENLQKQFIRNYFSKMVKGQNRKRLAFKITGPPRIGYLLDIFPDARFVLIRRNYIPTISSLLKVGFWSDLGMKKLWWTGPNNEKEKQWAVDHGNEPELLAAFQLKKIHWAEKLEIDKYKPDLLEINYEEFVSAPGENINKILIHCELSYDKRIDSYLEKNPVISRNKSDNEYFDKESLRKINLVLRGELIS